MHLSQQHASPGGVQPQDGHCSVFQDLRGFHLLQKPYFLLFCNGSCVNILQIRLVHLMIKDVVVADVMAPD